MAVLKFTLIGLTTREKQITFYNSYHWKKRILAINSVSVYLKREGKKKALNFVNKKKLQEDRNLPLLLLFISAPNGYVFTNYC